MPSHPHRIAAAVTVVALTMTACAQPEARQETVDGGYSVPGVAPLVGQPEDTAPNGIVAAPDVAEDQAQGDGSSQSPSGGDGGDDGGGTQPGGGDTGGATGGGSGQPSPTTGPTDPAAPEPVLLVSADDAAGDYGLQGTDLGDLRRVTVTSVGNDVEVTVTLGTELPQLPREGERVFIGVDLNEGDRENNYQFFVTFNADGWLVYLSTPEGIVVYPGDFVIGGDTMLMRVPWSAVGTPASAPVTAYVEWEYDDPDAGLIGSALGTTQSKDQLDGQPHAFRRS